MRENTFFDENFFSFFNANNFANNMQRINAVVIKETFVILQKYF